MAEYIITQVAFKEISDFKFRVVFKHNGLQLDTPELERSSTEEEVKGVILNTIKLSLQKRSDETYGDLKITFDSKETLTIKG